MKSDIIDITMQKHAETEKAIFVSDSGDENDGVWLPKSQIEIEHKTNRGTAHQASASIVVITLPEWLAIEKGLV